MADHRNDSSSDHATGGEASTERSDIAVIVIDASDLTRHTRGDRVSPERLYALDSLDTERTLAASFVASCNEAFYKLQRVSKSITEGTAFEADLAYIEAKEAVRSLANFRKMGEGVSLVIWWLIKFSNSTDIATESTATIEAMKLTVQKLKNSPNLDFGSAMELVDDLETKLGEYPAPSFAAISALLTGDVYQPGDGNDFPQ